MAKSPGQPTMLMGPDATAAKRSRSADTQLEVITIGPVGRTSTPLILPAAAVVTDQDA